MARGNRGDQERTGRWRDPSATRMWPVRAVQTLVWVAVLIAVSGGLRAWLIDSDASAAQAAAERAIAAERQRETDPAATTTRVERLAEQFIRLWAEGLPTDGLTTEPIPVVEPRQPPFLVEVVDTIRANRRLESGDLIWRVVVRTVTQPRSVQVPQLPQAASGTPELVEEWFDLRAVSNAYGVWIAGAPTPARPSPPAPPAPFVPVAVADPQLGEDLQGFFTAWLTGGGRLDLWTSGDADLDALAEEAAATAGGRIIAPRVTAVRGPDNRGDGTWTVGVRVEADRAYEWTLRMARNGPRWLVVETVLVPPINPAAQTATTTTTISEEGSDG